ncbi:MAG: hypothetical protein AAF511_08205, partial [Pseudomonadota bacterium]
MTNTPDPEDHSNPASMRNPPLAIRLISAFFINRYIDPKRQSARRMKAEERRRTRGERHTVEYFHQTDDPYSHLAVQLLSSLQERYNIDLKTHLIRGTGGKSQPFYTELAAWARQDATLIAEDYGVSFPPQAHITPPPDLLNEAERSLAATPPTEFASRAPAISQAVWEGDREALAAFPKAGIG